MKKSFLSVVWIAILNLPLALYIGNAYAPDNSSSPWFAIGTFYFASIGHFFLCFFISSLVLITPALVVKKTLSKYRYAYAVTIVSLLHIILATDAKVFELYRFHLNWSILDIFLNTNGEVISLSNQTWASIALQALVCILYSLASTAAAILLGFKIVKTRYFVIPFLIMYALANLAHAYGNAKQLLPVAEIQNRLPFYKPLTMNSFMLKVGLISKEDFDRSPLEISENGVLDYPKHDLMYLKNARSPYNVLLITVDSLRKDVFTQENMPHTYAYANNAYKFNNHYSASNATRGGIFGLFYGLPPSYWTAALRSATPSIITKVVLDRNYAYGIFTSANLYRPEFNTTVFAQVPNLRTDSRGNNAVERDLAAMDDFNTFLGSLKNDQKFFSFVYLDNVHHYQTPLGEERPFTPTVESVNHMDLNDDTDPQPIFNMYRNSVYYADKNIAKILKMLEEHGYADNTIVIITSDHGEEFNDNKQNFWGHNSNFTDVQTKIPLIIKWPGLGGSEVDKLTSAYDITATLLPRVFGVRNNISDFSIGEDLFSERSTKYVLVGSQLENAIIEDDRIVLINKLGMLDFKDKQYKTAKDETRDTFLFDAIGQMSDYFKRE